jgi:hypothetical protein
LQQVRLLLALLRLELPRNEAAAAQRGVQAREASSDAGTHLCIVTIIIMRAVPRAACPAPAAAAAL